jgi:hypothetical protein
MHPLVLFNHIILACYDPIFRQLGNTEFQESKGLDSSKRVQVYFHATGYDILPPNRYIEKAVTFQCIH